MKDEEMAEEYFNSECLHSYADTEEELKEDVVSAFLNGLKAGRPQWHDLRKDKNDLPKEQKEYWCKINYYESDGVFNGCLIYSPKLKGFYLDKETEEGLFRVTAWCEIPTFDKE